MGNKTSKNQLHRNKKYPKIPQKSKVQFHIKKRILENLHKYCISLWLASSGKFIDINRPKEGFKTLELLSKEPNLIRSGTLTFVKTQNRYFGITCDHVLKVLKQKNQDYFNDNNIDLKIDFEPYILTTVLFGTIPFSSSNFFQPIPQYPDKAPDIRIIELTKEIIEQKLKKKAINLDEYEDTPDDLSFAIAVGFPENLKKIEEEESGSTRIAMPHSLVIAELNGKYHDKISMHSIIEEKIDRNFSGMSGGPIFWVQKNKHNILGIIFESPNNNYSIFDENTIHLRGEVATPTLIKKWIHNIFNK